MNNQDKILDLIKRKHECKYLDYKAKMYPSKGAIDFLKDVLAMANSDYRGPKYIILGVKDDLINGRRIIGIDPDAKLILPPINNTF